MGSARTHARGTLSLFQSREEKRSAEQCETLFRVAAVSSRAGQLVWCGSREQTCLRDPATCCFRNGSEVWSTCWANLVQLPTSAGQSPPLVVPGIVGRPPRRIVDPRNRPYLLFQTSVCHITRSRLAQDAYDVASTGPLPSEQSSFSALRFAPDAFSTRPLHTCQTQTCSGSFQSDS